MGCVVKGGKIPLSKRPGLPRAGSVLTKWKKITCEGCGHTHNEYKCSYCGRIGEKDE